MPVGQDGTQNRSLRSAGPGRRTGGGDNHGRGARAIARALLAALTLAAAPAGLAQTVPPPVPFQAPAPAEAPAPDPAAAPGAPAAEDNPLVQRGVPAEATAQNAVVARDRALASGQRIAYERMAAALGLPREVSDAQIQAQVASLVIESERITQRGYAARITVNFLAPGRGGAVPAPAGQGGPVVASVEAVAQYRSLPEYAEIARRLGASAVVARTEVVSISGEAARLRLELRRTPALAAIELGQAGLLLDSGAAGAPGEGWRLGLAGSR